MSFERIHGDMTTLPKLSYRLSAFPIKSLVRYFIKPDKMILKFINKINEWLFNVFWNKKKNVNDRLKILPDIRT